MIGVLAVILVLFMATGVAEEEMTDANWQGDSRLNAIIPCGDSFVYYGRGDNGYMRWLVCKPGEKSQALPLKYTDEVFCGFDGRCWYAVHNNTSSTLYSIDLNGKKSTAWVP